MKLPALQRYTLLTFYLMWVMSPAYSADTSPNENIDELMLGFDEPTAEVKNNLENELDNELDNLLDGFDDTPSDSSITDNAVADSAITENEIPANKIIEKKWDITTLLSLSSSYSYQQPKPSSGQADYRGFTRFKFKLQPELRYKFNHNWDSVFSLNTFYDLAYTLKDRETFTKEALDSNESQFEVSEFYVRGTVTNDIDVKIGRQIVVWGKSDSLRVVDILNPLDFREPGMVDIEDLRLPVTMVKADYYSGDWNLSAIIIPEIRFNKMPAYGSDFYLAGNSQLPNENIPDDITNPEFALAMIGNFSGWDLSLHLANYYDDQPHLVTGSSPSLAHSRLNMAGIATNIVKGSWLFKSEMGYFDGLEFANTNNTFARADIMAGIDYNGIADVTFSIEAMNRHILDYQSVLSSVINNTKQDESQISLRYTATFFHQRLQAMVLTSFFGSSPNDGGFYRGSLDYEIDDGMSVIFGGIVYQSGDSLLLQSIAQNDRLFIDFRYSF